MILKTGEETLAEHAQVRNRVNAKMKSTKREHWAKFTSDMDCDLHGAQRKVWKMIRNKKSVEDDSEQEKTSERVRAN